MQHCLDIASFSYDELVELLDAAYVLKTQPPGYSVPVGETCALIFAEPSTRTRCSFEIAAKRLGFSTLVLDSAASSACKGESLVDTVKNLEAMGVRYFVIRQPNEQWLQELPSQAHADSHLINAGSGMHSHPTQALLDMLTIRQYKKDFASLKVAIMGDIQHSRVARSQCVALHKLGVPEIRLLGPAEWVPESMGEIPVQRFEQLEEGLQDADVVICLRIQRERLRQDQQVDAQAFHQAYGLTPERLKLAKKDAIVLHPGPVNREVELSSEVMDGPQSVILEQVSHGVLLRMAVLRNMSE